ncbi:hypothetical protein RJT34_13678 [Clitoria ternatea]|uniref:E3 ubiquitin-protein ligase RMA n=1 Tax=Clitoria ternatea TaxID=43366 RepID=A0AAN9JRZ3_CLITE
MFSVHKSPGSKISLCNNLELHIKAIPFIVVIHFYSPGETTMDLCFLVQLFVSVLWYEAGFSAVYPGLKNHYVTQIVRSLLIFMALHHYLKATPRAMTETENSSGCFDCNICLDFAHEPVVTLCGHLYCWPCIYKWLHVQNDSLAPDEHPQCPVCKANISHNTMVPLYGRGHAVAEGKASSCDVLIPPRPPALGAQALLATSSQSGQQLPYGNPYQGGQQHFTEEDGTSQSHMLNLGTPGSYHPMVGMFGEMVYARVFGNSENLYAYPNSYQLMGSNSPRLRRQEMQADKCLNRISIFLFCCFLLCLVVF